MYEIENDVKMLKQRRKPGAMPQAIKKAIDDYKAAYKALYGVGAPNVEWRDGFVYVEGLSGVSLAIFRSRIKQLRYRKG